MKNESLKRIVFDKLSLTVECRIEAALFEIKSIQDSKTNETKSSAGDKYETGMAMLQIEEQKAVLQLARALEFKQILARIDPNEKHESVQLGSFIKTNQGFFYFSAALGKIDTLESDVFALSIGSPLGQVLKGQKAKFSALFQGKTIEILEIF